MLKVLIFIALCLVIVSPVLATQGINLTQRDLMLGLVEGLGWSFGLPEEPEDSDYLRILNGVRKLRIEIETNYATDTRVIIEEIFSFGNFSGQGWVRVPNRPTDIPVYFNLPISGTYNVNARLFRKGHMLRIGDQQFDADGADQLTDVDLGVVYLQAGRQEMILTVPARGGIDFIEIEAPAAPAISPDGGWSLDAPLTFNDLAVTSVQLLSLHSILPNAGEDIVFEAEDFPLPQNSRLSTNRHLGAPSQGEWVSVGADPVTFEIGVDVPDTGVYDLSVRCVGKSEITGRVNAQPFLISPDRQFSDKQAGGVVLDKGENPIAFQVPPHCGIDQIILSPRASSLEDFSRLVGLPLTGNPSPTQFNSFLKLLAAFGLTR